MPADSLWVFDGDLYIDQPIITNAEAAGGLEAALARAFVDHPKPHQLELIRKAAQLSKCGDNATANIQLAFGGFQRMRMRTLQSREQDCPTGDVLGKYDQDEPRVPAGSGRESGRWTGGEEPTSSGRRQTTPRTLYHPIASADDPRGNKQARAAATAAGLNRVYSTIGLLDRALRTSRSC